MDQSTGQAPNPLNQYFRTFKLYTKLPSGSSYYNAEDVMLTEDGEIGVMPMTGKDELTLKNPDALLNGEALIDVITSCVPNVKKPRALLTNDIDALITSIRYATYNDTLETALICPKCKAENSYKLDLQYALDNMESLEPHYVVNLNSGLSVFIRPYAFPELMKHLKAQFEQKKLARSIENDFLTDDERSAIFTKAFKQIAVLKFELMASSIIRIIDESKGIDVDNKKFILEFLHNIDKKSIDKIHDKIKEINAIGIKKSFTAVCSSCKHEWESEIDFNPVNFS